jgi:hypothetical protein
MIAHQTAYPTVGYAPAISALGTGGINTACPSAVQATACIVDGQLASGTKSGYGFKATGQGNAPFYNIRRLWQSSRPQYNRHKGFLFG